MCKESNDRQGHNGTLKEDQKQILQRHRDLAAHDDAADLRHIDQLGHTGGPKSPDDRLFQVL